MFLLLDIHNRLHKQAGVLLLGTAGLIPPMSIQHMETTCSIDEDKVIHPFAFRVHTHSLGKVVTGYRIRDGKWTMIGRRNPMKPQMFYPVNNTEPIVLGDIMAARCTMQSNRRRITFIGWVYWVSNGGGAMFFQLINVVIIIFYRTELRTMTKCAISIWCITWKMTNHWIGNIALAPDRRNTTGAMMKVYKIFPMRRLANWMTKCDDDDGGDDGRCWIHTQTLIQRIPLYKYKCNRIPIYTSSLHCTRHKQTLLFFV